MLFCKVFTFATAVLCSSTLALPQSTNFITRRSPFEPVFDPSSQCRNCKDCWSHGGDTPTKTLVRDDSTDANTSIYNDGNGLTVDFKSKVNTKSTTQVEYFTITNKQELVAYKVQLTFKKKPLPPGTGHSPISENREEFVYELAGPAFCTSQIPAGYTMSQVDTVKVQPM